NAGCSSGTPGLTTTRSARASVPGWWPPVSICTPDAASAAASSNELRLSLSVTRAPRLRSSSAAASPLRAAPTTTTLRPSTEKACSAMRSPQLQRGEAEQGEDHRDDQKAGDDLRLAPADQLEMVVDLRHLRHPPTPTLDPDAPHDHLS